MQEALRRIDCSGTLPTNTSKRTTNIPQQQAGRFADETHSAEVTQWKLMRAFHSTSGWHDNFPPQRNHLPLLGESVLLWTMLQSIPDTPWLRTYAWTEELDTVQLPPYIISKALWNQRSRNHCQRPWPSNSNHHRPQQPQQTTRSGAVSPSLEIPRSQQPPSPPTQWTRGPTPSNHLAPVCVSPSTVTHPDTQAQQVFLPQNSVIKGELTRRALVAILYWLLTLNTTVSQPSPPFLPCLFGRSSNWFHRQHIGTKIIQFRTSYCRWITAIIQKRWVIAWDLLAHRNLEDK